MYFKVLLQCLVVNFSRKSGEPYSRVHFVFICATPRVPTFMQTAVKYIPRISTVEALIWFMYLNFFFFFPPQHLNLQKGL